MRQEPSDPQAILEEGALNFPAKRRMLEWQTSLSA